MIELDPLDLTDVHERVWMSPFHDTKAVYLEYIQSAQRSIHINIFGFHIPGLVDTLNAMLDKGIKVDAIFDHSQAQGTAEASEIAKARFPYLIGTSPRHGQLLHLKASVIDETRVECGSWNYSESASDQLNDLHIIDDPRMAQFYLLAHDIVRAFIVRHEQIFQPKRATPVPAATVEGADTAAADPTPDAGQVHRKDVAAPWLDNQPLPDSAQTAKPARKRRAAKVAA